MKIASIIARYLIALVFIVFGLNGFLHFLPMKPPSSETRHRQVEKRTVVEFYLNLYERPELAPR